MTEDDERKQEGFWVLRAQSGDKDALNRLLQGAQARLHRYVVSLVREPDVAEDVLQEVFLRIYRKLGWLKDPALFRSWSYQIATREAFRRLGRERVWNEQIRDDELLERVPAPEPDATLHADLRERLPDCLARLSPASRAVLVLYYVHELTLGETAAVLGIPLGTVKSRLSYGLSRLREQTR